jgi:glycosyltransferase involved in cell wall biosynthesis
VSNFLQSKFGGTKIVHGVDIYAFDPCRLGKLEARRNLGLDDDSKYILFSGMPREHKGVEELIKSVVNLNLKNLRLLMVGGDIQNSYYKRLLSLGGECILSFGPRPHSEMATFLAAADIVVLPQRKTVFSEAQVPAKVFEAMAMAKPIISTNVSDLPEILDGCGIIVKSSLDTMVLESQIEMLLDDMLESSVIGARAREKCISQYSWDTMEKKIVPIFQILIN